MHPWWRWYISRLTPCPPQVTEVEVVAASLLGPLADRLRGSVDVMVGPLGRCWDSGRQHKLVRGLHLLGPTLTTFIPGDWPGAVSPMGARPEAWVQRRGLDACTSRAGHPGTWRCGRIEVISSHS